MDKSPKLSEITSRISGHLKRFEADPKINRSKTDRTHPYYLAGACDAGRYVMVTYVNYHGAFSLSKQEATDYLAWLDAGNVGKFNSAVPFQKADSPK